MTYPLNLACKHGCPIEAIKLFVDAGADINRRDKNEYRPIDYSYMTGKFETFELLLESGALPELREGLAFTMLKNEKMDYLKTLVEHGFDSNETLLTATRMGKYEIMKYLISVGANVNHGELNKPLNYAVTNRYYETPTKKQNLKFVKILLETGADPNLKGEYFYPLEMAASEGEEEVVDILLQHGAKINDEHGVSYALMSAASNGRLKIVEKLINLGANVNGTINESSPLFCAILSEDVDTVRLLLNRGADFRHKVRRMGNAVYLAIKRENIEIIKLTKKYF